MSFEISEFTLGRPLPKEWCVCKISEVADVNVRTISKKNPPKEIAYLDISSVATRLHDKPHQMAYENAPSRAQRIVSSGDTLIATVRPNLRSFVYISNPEKNLIASTGFACVSPKSKHDALFLHYFLTSDALVDYFVRLADGAAYPAFDYKLIPQLDIPWPPEIERHQIGEILGALDDRITFLRKTNATLEAIAQALFKSWFVDFDPVHAKQQGIAPEGIDEATAALFPGRFEESELGLVPRGWSIGSIGKIAEVIDCLHAKKPELLASGRPYLQLNNIRDDGLLDTSKLSFISEADYNKWVSRIEVSEGDCVITNVGRVGAVAQIPELFQAAMGRNMTAIRMRKEWQYPTYLVELLQSPFMEVEIKKRTDIGTILDALNVRNIPLLKCVLAGHDVLTAFEGVTRPLRATMEANLERANILAALRDTLLPRLISGQLRLPEAEAAQEEAIA